MNPLKFVNEPVLVHPQLENDPLKMKNKVGTIISIDLEHDNIIVSFGEEGRAMFSTDALLVLREPDLIMDAENDVTLMPFWDYEDIMGIITFAESARLDYRRFAIQLSQKNPDAMEYTMNTLRYLKLTSTERLSLVAKIYIKI